MLLLALEPRCQFNASRTQAVLVEQHHRVGGLKATQYELAFTLFLLLFGEGLGVLQLGQNGDGKGHYV